MDPYLLICPVIDGSKTNKGAVHSLEIILDIGFASIGIHNSLGRPGVIISKENGLSKAHFL